MLDGPDVVVAELICEHRLLDAVVVQLPLGLAIPRPRHADLGQRNLRQLQRYTDLGTGEHGLRKETEECGEHRQHCLNEGHDDVRYVDVVPENPNVFANLELSTTKGSSYS